MQLEGQLPSGAWTWEDAPSRLADKLRRWREALPWRKLALAAVVAAAVSTAIAGTSMYLLQVHRERVLRGNLALLRTTISEYSRLEHHAPHRLADLVKDGYLLELPADPFTKQADWDPDFAEVPTSIDREHFGVVDVHSRSTKRGRDGRAYCDW